MRVGVIGLGNIGGAIAKNLLAGEHTVVVCDADASRHAPLVALGARAASAPAAVGEQAEITLLSLPTPAVVAEVADAWLLGAGPDAVLVDLSTNAPTTVRSLGARLGAAGRHLLE